MTHYGLSTFVDPAPCFFSSVHEVFVCPMNNLHPLSQQLPHSYSTRKAHNVPIRPSPRLGSSPTPNSTQHPDPLPQFPPTHIILHPDDANSKVFLAIGRAFLSVVRTFFLSSFSLLHPRHSYLCVIYQSPFRITVL